MPWLCRVALCGAFLPSGSTQRNPTQRNTWPNTWSVAGDLSAYLGPGQPQQLSAYLAQTLDRFEGHVAEDEARLEELERLLLPAMGGRGGWGLGGAGEGGGVYGPRDTSEALALLPNLMRNLHSFLIHVAAQVSCGNWAAQRCTLGPCTLLQFS